MLTGRVGKGQQSDLRRTALFRHLSDERRLDAVEQLIPGWRGGPADDAPGDSVRDRLSRRDQRDHRAAHDGAAR
jgi:hypothetical protein